MSASIKKNVMQLEVPDGAPGTGYTRTTTVAAADQMRVEVSGVCTCGAEFHGGYTVPDEEPMVIHAMPPCDDYSRLAPPDFLRHIRQAAGPWVRDQKAPLAPSLQDALQQKPKKPKRK